MSKGLVRIDVIKIAVITAPVELKAAQSFQVFGIAGNHPLQEEIILQTGRQTTIHDKLAVHTLGGQINIERGLVGIGQVRLVDGGEYLRKDVRLYIVQFFGVCHDIPVGPSLHDLYAEAGTDRMQRIDSAEHIGVLHAKTYGAMAAHAIAGHAA